MLTISGCEERLGRLRALMDQRELDLALITNQQNVYYFSGFLPPWSAKAVLVVRAHDAILVAGAEPEASAATSVRTYAASSLATIRLDQSEHIAGALHDLLEPARHAGTELATFDAHVRGRLTGKVVDLEADIYHLRRCKSADELALIRKSVACIDACYHHAKAVIEPGLTELDLYRQLYGVAVETAGEPIGRFGNDFQCGSIGGPARDRPAQQGEIWILDISVGYRGYAADESRGFPVGGTVTDEQHAVWERLRDALAYVEKTVRPGVSCKTLYHEVKAQLDAHLPGSFCHHLGHGFGLYAHEAPHLNSEWDETFEQGDTFTAEPGLYDESLRGGLRLENDYLVTADGVERLTQAPLELL